MGPHYDQSPISLSGKIKDQVLVNLPAMFEIVEAQLAMPRKLATDIIFDIGMARGRMVRSAFSNNFLLVAQKAILKSVIQHFLASRFFIRSPSDHPHPVDTLSCWYPNPRENTAIW